MGRRVEAFGGIRGLSFANLWWLTWIVVYKPLVATSGDYKPLVADGLFYKPLLAGIDRRLQALGGRWSHFQAFRGIRGSWCTCLFWHTWIVVHKPLVADGVVYKPWVADEGVYKRLVADGVIYKPFVAYVDRREHAFGGIRGSSFVSPWWHIESFTSLWRRAWIAVCKPLVADGVMYKRKWHTWIVVCKPLVP